MFFETRILVVSIKGLDSPKLESVIIPASLPVNIEDFLLYSCNVYEIITIDNLSPNEIK